MADEGKPRSIYDPRHPTRAWPRRWSLVDTVVLYPGQKLDDGFFVDHTKFKDATPKTAAATNMSLSGTLGVPLTFDAFRLELHFEHFERPSDVQAVLRNAVLTLDPHLDERVTLPAAAMDPLVVFPNSRAILRHEPKPEDPGSQERWDVGDAMAAFGRRLWDSTLEQMRLLKESGVWRHYAAIVSLGREGDERLRRYGPTSLIACKIGGDAVTLAGPVRLQCSLTGILHRGNPPKL